MSCYQPNLSHGECPAGHGIHLDVDHYDTPRWVHCTVADLMTCPAEMSDLAGDYVGKHRVQP